MQNILNRLFRRHVSTQRVEDMSSFMARTALDTRVKHMLAIHDAAGMPTPTSFPALSNPIQSLRIS